MTDRYEIVGTLSREQATQIAELLAGSSVIWCQGHTYPCDGIVIRTAQSAEDICPTTGRPHVPGNACIYCHIGNLGAKS